MLLKKKKIVQNRIPNLSNISFSTKPNKEINCEEKDFKEVIELQAVEKKKVFSANRKT